MKDGERVAMKAGEYELERSMGSLHAIRGHGLDRSGGNRDALMIHERRILTSDSVVTTIEGKKRTAFYYALPVTVVVIVGFWFLLRSGLLAN
jgi:hypothetical protein